MLWDSLLLHKVMKPYKSIWCKCCVGCSQIYNHTYLFREKTSIAGRKNVCKKTIASDFHWIRAENWNEFDIWLLWERKWIWCYWIWDCSGAIGSGERVWGNKERVDKRFPHLVWLWYWGSNSQKLKPKRLGVNMPLWWSLFYFFFI